MSFSLVNNIAGQSAQTKLAGTTRSLNSTLARLSSGLRINKSGDDAAGLAIANKFRSDIAVLNQGVRNANDGLSTLQIIDGGLNTISGLLDRAASLSSQSASGTFTGDRDILQNELSNVLSEIDRQAQNIGLGGDSGTAEGRYNKSLNVFLGGGSEANSTNNGVTVDLANSRVDRTGLDLAGINIGQAQGSVTGNRDIAEDGLTADETLTFRYVNEANDLATFEIDLAANDSSEAVLEKINSDENALEQGIKASLDASGKLVLKSSKFFAVSSDLADAAGQTGIGGAGAAADDVAITSAAHTSVQALSVGAGAATTQNLDFTSADINDGGTAVSVSFAAQTTATLAADAITTAANVDALNDKGIFAIQNKDDDSQVTFVSLKAFSVGVRSNTGATNANNNIDTLAGATAATAATVTGGGEEGAKDALESIKNAVAALGAIQGGVGAGQNNLTQAIDLATSQISNFQAAESSIRDADIAAEASNMSRLTTLQQAGVSALAQANQSTQAVLSLLR